MNLEIEEIKFFNTSVLLDLGTPYIFKVPEKVFDVLTNKIQQIVCKKPQQCIFSADLFQGFNQSVKLKFKFQGENNKSIMITFQIKELFYIDKNDYITYNFDKYTGVSDPIQIYLGLLFLNKMDFGMKYDRHFGNKSYKIYLRDKKNMKLNVSVILTIIFISLILAFLTTACMIQRYRAKSIAEDLLKNSGLNFDTLSQHLMFKEND